MSNVTTVYLIHHSHTDVGYTHDQPIVWDLHGRFLDEAVRLADKYRESESDGAFRWTVENTAVLYEWLTHAPAAQVERFWELEKLGRIEVTGMFANMTPLADMDELVESMQLVGLLRERYGATITSAMNCDVNGENWPLVDLLLDTGIDGFSMAINTHFGGSPLDRPDVFWWEGPSGRRILAYNGWPYDTGWRFGIGQSEQMLEDWWTRIDQRLDEIYYSLPVLMMQSFHPFSDNGPAFEEFTRFIDAWNAKGKLPHLVMATPRMWWAAVRSYAGELPVYRGDWTDFWNFGCISSAREQAVNRNNRMRLRAADAVAAAVTGLAAANINRTLARYRTDAWKQLLLWDEHTWGADLSLRAPDSEDTATQWYHKALTAYQARSLSLMLQRDALADFSRHVARGKPDDLLVFNPLPWARKISGEVPHHVAFPRGVPEDATAGRHSQDRVWSTDLWVEAALSPDGQGKTPRLALKHVDVPGYGYRVISRQSLEELQPGGFSEDAVVENDCFRLSFDREKGGATSLYDLRLEREWVDQSAGYPLNGFVYEEVADHAAEWPRYNLFRMNWTTEQVERERGWKPGWRANRRQPAQVLTHRVYQTPLGKRVIQILDAPGISGALAQSIFLPDGEAYIEFESWFSMTLNTHPEATYLAFPFALPGATARLDLGGQSMIAGKDQIPGVCFDYYTAQQWVDLSTDGYGVTVALPENPMVMFGGFTFGANQYSLEHNQGLLLGWITNNYWETNFRVHQPGGVHARYRVYPHDGGFDLAAAQRAGLEAACQQPLLQHMGEPPEPERFAVEGSLLRLPEMLDPKGSVFTLHVKPASRGGRAVTVRLYNAADEPVRADIASGLLRIKAAKRCDLMENETEELRVVNGTAEIDLPARQVAVVRLVVE